MENPENMNWYNYHKVASGPFEHSRETISLINYFVSQVRKNWHNGSYTASETIPIKQLLNFGKYNPLPQSIYSTRIKNPDFPVNIIFVYKIQIVTGVKPNIRAEVNPEIGRGQITIKITASIDRELYVRFEDLSDIDSQKKFDELFQSRLSLNNVLQHEFVHPLKEILGYAEKVPYVNPQGQSVSKQKDGNVVVEEGGGTKEERYRKYVAQPLEREEMLNTVYNSIKNYCQQEKENRETGHMALYMVYSMYKGISQLPPPKGGGLVRV